MMTLMVFALIVALASPSYAASLGNAEAVFRDDFARVRKARSFFGPPDPYGGGSIDAANMVDPLGPVDPTFTEPAAKEDSSEDIDAIIADLQGEIQAIKENPRMDPGLAEERIAEIQEQIVAQLPPATDPPAAPAPEEQAAQAEEQQAEQQSQQEQQQQAEAGPSPADPASPPEPSTGGQDPNEDGDGDGNNGNADVPSAAEIAAEAQGAAAEAGAGAEAGGGGETGGGAEPPAPPTTPEPAPAFEAGQSNDPWGQNEDTPS